MVGEAPTEFVQLLPCLLGLTFRAQLLDFAQPLLGALPSFGLRNALRSLSRLRSRSRFAFLLAQVPSLLAQGPGICGSQGASLGKHRVLSFRLRLRLRLRFRLRSRSGAVVWHGSVRLPGLLECPLRSRWRKRV